jgi:integrase
MTALVAGPADQFSQDQLGQMIKTASVSAADRARRALAVRKPRGSERIAPSGALAMSGLTGGCLRVLARRAPGGPPKAEPGAAPGRGGAQRSRLDAQVSAVTVAKAYRLLKAVFNTAVDDGLIRHNPCRIKGAGQERSPERPVLTVPEVYALADAVGGRYRAPLLLGVFGSLRWGELAALRRSDIDMQARTVRISRQLSEQRGGGFAFGPPKSDAGQRLVATPEVITSDLASHIVTYVAPGDAGLVFTSPEGRPLRLSNFCRHVWRPALRTAGLPMIHFHDLRHTGNQLAANAGANLRELMDRMGHSTTHAAMAYLHGSDQRQQLIADELSRQAAAALGGPNPGRSGTQRARRRGKAS